MTPLFLNFSNHPSTDWDEAQMAAAQAYGVVEDLPFPCVSPSASEAEIRRMADEYAARLAERGRGARLTVHVMGEMTLAFAVVSRLTARGIDCVASTTERNVSVGANGDKISQFRFVRFRHY